MSSVAGGREKTRSHFTGARCGLCCSPICIACVCEIQRRCGCVLRAHAGRGGVRGCAGLHTWTRKMSAGTTRLAMLRRREGTPTPPVPSPPPPFQWTRNRCRARSEWPASSADARAASGRHPSLTRVLARGRHGSLYCLAGARNELYVTGSTNKDSASFSNRVPPCLPPKHQSRKVPEHCSRSTCARCAAPFSGDSAGPGAHAAALGDRSSAAPGR